MNGTMIDDMHYHEMAWHDVLVNTLKAPLTPEEVRVQLYGTAEEMFVRVFGDNRFTPEEVSLIAQQKESRYREEFLPQLKLIDGLDAFIESARSRKIPMAIGTAAPLLNIDFVLDNLNLRSHFQAVVGPDDVTENKPNPEVFLKAASRMGIAPEHCIVFEDAPKGIEAALRAGMKAIAITSYHSEEELHNDNVLFTIRDYTDARLGELF